MSKKVQIIYPIMKINITTSCCDDVVLTESLYLFSIHLLLFFFLGFFEKYQYFTRLRPMAPKISKLNQAPYKQNNMQHNSKTSLFTNSLSPLT